MITCTVNTPILVKGVREGVGEGVRVGENVKVGMVDGERVGRGKQVEGVK